MEHIDEEIIKAKKALARAEQKAHADETVMKELEESIFEEKIHLFEQEVSFAERVIPELKISIYMPETFFLFNNDLKNLIYPMGNNPSHVFGGENINFQLILSRLENKVSNEQIEVFLPFIKKVIENMGPKVRVLGTGIVTKDDYNIGIMEFVSRAVDMNVYNVMFYFSINNELMMGSVNFPAKFQKRMIRIAKEMIDSLKVLAEN